VLDAIRTLLGKMNVRIVEPSATRGKGVCCGDTFYGTLPVKQVLGLMAKRAGEMPVEDVVVYCVSCAKSMFNGGRRPRYLVDLLFGEETIAGTTDPDAWHAEVDRFIGTH
jgi:Fe-S oxidoreductase